MLVFGGSSSGGASGASQYQISKSLRFQSANSAYLTRTPAVAGNRKTWTFSAWIKRVKFGTNQQIFDCGSAVSGTASRAGILFNTSDQLAFFSNPSGSAETSNAYTSAVFRDPTAWFHVVVAIDTTQALNTNRIKFYVNGVQATFSSAVYMAQNEDAAINQAIVHDIGRYYATSGASPLHPDLYLADVHFIDGQALTPSSFGQTDATTGQWVAKAYTGSYGTNGFRLDFSDNSSVVALGKDNDGRGIFSTAAMTFGTSNGAWYGPAVQYDLGSNVSGDFEFNFANTWDNTSATYMGSLVVSLRDSSGATIAYVMPNDGYTVSTNYNRYAQIGSTIVLNNNNTSATVFSDQWTFSRTGNNMVIRQNGATLGTVANTTAVRYIYVQFTKYSTNAIAPYTLSNMSFSASGINLTKLTNSLTGWSSTITGATTYPVTAGASFGATSMWHPVGFSVTAGATNDSLTDVPTPYADGSNGRGNYSTWNPVYNIPATFSAGNLTATTSALAARALSSIPVSSGKWYCEIVYANNGVFGISDGTFLNSYLGAADGSKSVGFHTSTSVVNTYVNGSFLGGVSTTIAVGDIIGLALDADNKIIYFYRNGTQITSYNYSALGWQRAVFAVGHTSSLTYAANFGQRPFAYTPPTGFKALNTQNLPAPTITKPGVGFDTVLYTGTGAALTPTSSLAFSPDLVWIKGRSGATDHAVYDTVRGATIDLVTNSSALETTQSTGLTAFNSNGFTVGTLAKLNTSAATYVAWCWDAGESTVTNNSGSVASQVRANPSLGVSIVTATTTSSSVGSSTVGHGLNAVPHMIIARVRNASYNWCVYHVASGNTKAWYLNANNVSDTGANLWNNTSPTSSVFTLGSSFSPSQPIIAYCFTPVEGYSSFGQYTGNANADGPFVYTGFRPAFVMIKALNTTGSANWVIFDDERKPANTNDKNLNPNAATAESAASYVDFLSNGFKIRNNSADINGAWTHIYAAFASAPFKYSNAY